MNKLSQLLIFSSVLMLTGCLNNPSTDYKQFEPVSNPHHHGKKSDLGSPYDYPKNFDSLLAAQEYEEIPTSIHSYFEMPQNDLKTDK